jgi:hypothetical protein
VEVAPRSLALNVGRDEMVRAVSYDADQLPASSPRRFAFVSRDSMVAKVDSTGRITGVRPGVTSVRVTDREDPSRAAADVTVEVSASKAAFSSRFHIGFDLFTGFRAADETLDLHASVLSIPAISLFTAYGTERRGEVYAGIATGLTRLWNARAQSPDQPDTLLELNGETLLYGLAAGYEWKGLFVEWSFRRRQFRGVTWSVGDDEVSAPAGWPRSIDLTTHILRVGYGREF